MKLFNGRVSISGRNDFHGHIAAKTKKRAIELGKKAFSAGFTRAEIDNYWSPCWGNPMDGIPRDKEGVWLSEGRSGRVWQLVMTREQAKKDGLCLIAEVRRLRAENREYERWFDGCGMESQETLLAKLRGQLVEKQQQIERLQSKLENVNAD